MSAAPPLTIAQSSSAYAANTSRADSLFSPLVDFLCLGGGSLLLVALIASAQFFIDLRPQIIVASALVAHFVNNPHFANSYQLFYSKFREKLASERYAKGMRVRYAFAGIVVPAGLFSFILCCALTSNATLLTKAVGAMSFLAGWHYVKQGYGILIVTSVLKKAFFSTVEKRIALISAYCCWICFWLGANYSLAKRDFFGIQYYTAAVPQWLLIASLAVAIFTTLATTWMFLRKWHLENRWLALNGVLAYLMTIYAWLLLLLDPLYVFVIPACHSLQYLLIVWRYRINLENDGTKTDGMPFANIMGNSKFRFALFVAVGIVLGYLGFWHLPELLDEFVRYDRASFGASLFLFSFWIFINIHHYAMDNVMWRRGNPDTTKYLFAHQSGK